jgi:hypothetical protein
VWWAPVAAYYFGLHAAAVWRTWMQARPASPKKAGLYSVAVIGMLWIFFAYTPLGAQVLHGGPENADEAKKAYSRSVADATPLDAVDYLLAHPPQGLVFNSYEWGDYLLWAGPEDMQVFVASHAHLIPKEVWQHYLEVANAGPGWSDTLDRYSINTIVINPSKHSGLARRLENETGVWEKAYGTKMTAIFQRNNPI